MIKVEFCMHESEVKMLNRIREAMESVKDMCEDTKRVYNVEAHKYEHGGPEHDHLCKAAEELALAYSTYVATLVYDTGKELE